MILKVNKDICEIKQNEVWNVGDYNVHTVQVELSPEFNGLVNKVRYFVEDKSYDMLITDNVAQVPYEATVMEGTIKIGVYGYDADTDILVQSTSPVNKYITSGTYTGEADNTQPLTPTDKQQMETAIQKNTDDIIDLQNNKQNVLISGENIKTINNESILGSGNIEIQGGGGGTSDYTDLTNKPKINNVELNGNKTSSDLGLQPAGNYALESEIPTKTSELTNDSGFITGYTETDPTVPNHVKNITQANITNWNNKADISDIPDVSDFITKDVNDLTYYYTKTEVDGKISAVYKYKGTVATYSDLPSTGLNVGDVYNVEIDGSNYAWTGTVWDKLGGDIDLSGYQTKIDSSHKLSSDLVDDSSGTNKFTSTSEKNAWNSKYTKPSGGIPKTDLASSVQTSLGKADTALQSETYTGTITGVTMNGVSKGTSGVVDLGTVITSHQDISGKENTLNKVTSISASSTDTQYPSAKCVYNIVGNIETLLGGI